MDLYSRQIVGWATHSTMTGDLVLQALLAAVWKRKPEPGVVIHWDQGSQFTSNDWQSFLKAHHIGLHPKSWMPIQPMRCFLNGSDYVTVPAVAGGHVVARDDRDQGVCGFYSIRDHKGRRKIAFGNI